MAANQEFKVGHLVWAKIRGYPTWPAKIIEDIATLGNKYSVVFFGTKETSFVKPSDICDYLENRNIYEKVKNKKPEYALAIKEIRQEAGIPSEDDSGAPFEAPAQQAPVEAATSSYGRIRKPSARVTDSNFVALGMGPTRKRHNSNSLSFDFCFDRPRTDSSGSAFGTKRSKGPSITADFEFDILNAGNLLQGDLGNLFESFDSDGGTGGYNQTRRRRRTTSKLLDDILSRDRMYSTSSQGGNIMDIFESLNPSDFYNAIDQLPSEESDRPQTPENISPMPNHTRVCPKCSMPQKYVDLTWKCPNPVCATNGEIKTEFEDLESYFDMGTNTTATEPSVFSHKKTKKIKKKPKDEPVEQHIESVAASNVKKFGRPRSYKVEKTPPVQSNGVRLCIFCNGHVRPQMCGGNKHRWRCVDKRCRKWYGWVRSNEEIPKDLGKKGRWKDLVLKVQGHTEDGQLVQMIPPPDDTPEDKIAEELKAKRKKKKLATMQRPLSPVTESQMAFIPTQMESRVHWWRPDRKRVEPSPERELEVNNMTIPSLCRIVEQSCRATAILTKSQTASGQDTIDLGTATGFIDMMMDTVFGSIGSLMSLCSNLPLMDSSQVNPKLIKNLEYIPIVNS